MKPTVLISFSIFAALCFFSSCRKAIVTPANTVSVASSTPTLCVNTALTSISHTTTGATGIGAFTGLPAGVTAAWAANVITISGMPTECGTFNYTIPLTGGSGTVTATGTIITTPVNTVSAAPSIPALLINTALTEITHTTTGATGIGAATGLPIGLTATWAANLINLNGIPTESGTFNYTIPLTGGCGTVTATGTINVMSDYLPLNIGAKYIYSHRGDYYEPGFGFYSEDGECQWEFIDRNPTTPYFYRVLQTFNGIYVAHPDYSVIEKKDTTIITNQKDTLTFQVNNNGTVTITFPVMYWKYGSMSVDKYFKSSKTDTCFIVNLKNKICLSKNIGVKSLEYIVNANHSAKTSYTLVKGPY